MGNYLKVKSLGEQALIQYDWCGYKKGKLGDYPGGKIPIQEFFPGGSDSKESTCNTGDLGSTPGLGRSPGEGNDNPLQQSYLENPMDRGAWWATVHGITKGQTRLRQLHFSFHSGGAADQNTAANAGDTSLIPGLGGFHMLQGN